MDLQAISKESGKLIPAGLVELRKSDPDNLMETERGKVHQAITHARIVETYIEIMTAMTFLQIKIPIDIISPASVGLNSCLADWFSLGRT